MSIGNYFKKAAYIGLAGAVLCVGWDLARDISKHFEKINHYRNMSYQEVIAEIDTPQEAEWYVRNYIIPKEKIRMDSFRLIHQNRVGDCAEATVAAAALLSDDGFPPTYLDMRNENQEVGHAVFVYQSNGKWGTIGINSSDNQSPRFNSLEEIARHHGFEKYRLGTIGEGGIILDWITTGRDLVFSEGEEARIDLEAGYKRVSK
jgi:hypothetical protein